MITIRFGTWSRQSYGKHVFTRIRIAGFWTPFVNKKLKVQTHGPVKVPVIDSPQPYDPLDEIQMGGFEAYAHGYKSRHRSLKKAKHNRILGDRTKPSDHRGRA